MSSVPCSVGTTRRGWSLTRTRRTSMLLLLLIQGTANRLFISMANSANLYLVIEIKINLIYARYRTIRQKIGTVCRIKIFRTRLITFHKTQSRLIARKTAIIIITWRRQRALIRYSSPGRTGLTIDEPEQTIGRSDCITDYLHRDGRALITISRYLSHLSHMRPLIYTKLSITRILRETRLVLPLVGRLFGRKSSRNRPASEH